jgi:23S rRNA pseudouridine1911/1915/1917 synthase
MVKVSSSDVLAILRRFDLASDEHVPRHIERLKYRHPSPVSTLVSFTFLSKRWYILFDDTAEDNRDIILEQLTSAGSSPTGTLIENPHDTAKTYGLPFHGKDVYLFAAISDKKRLDSELAERYPTTSRSTWQ